MLELFTADINSLAKTSAGKCNSSRPRAVVPLSSVPRVAREKVKFYGLKIWYGVWVNMNTSICKMASI